MKQTTEQKIYYTLRVASAMCFIGHGAFGIITKAVWCNYFGVFGIPPELAYKLMPVVGTIDILMGISLLLYPTRAIMGWLVVWGMITALLRPLSGEPFAEFIERAGNFGAPFVLLLLSRKRSGGVAGLFRQSLAEPGLDAIKLKQIVWCLRVIVFLLLAGHGWLNLLNKQALLGQYASLGFAAPAKTAIVVGAAELAAAVSVLIRPVAGLLIIFFAWKMLSECFYPHNELFEWIERGGSYGSILAFYFASRKSAWVVPLSDISTLFPRTETPRL